MKAARRFLEKAPLERRRSPARTSTLQRPLRSRRCRRPCTRRTARSRSRHPWLERRDGPAGIRSPRASTRRRPFAFHGPNARLQAATRGRPPTRRTKGRVSAATWNPYSSFRFSCQPRQTRLRNRRCHGLRCGRCYARKYLIKAAIPSTRTRSRRTQTSPIPSIIHAGIPVRSMNISSDLRRPTHQSERTSTVVVAHASMSRRPVSCSWMAPPSRFRDSVGCPAASGPAQTPFSGCSPDRAWLPQFQRSRCLRPALAP